MEIHFPGSSVKANYQPKPNSEGEPSWEAEEVLQAGSPACAVLATAGVQPCVPRTTVKLLRIYLRIFKFIPK